MNHCRVETPPSYAVQSGPLAPETAVQIAAGAACGAALGAHAEAETRMRISPTTPCTGGRASRFVCVGPLFVYVVTTSDYIWFNAGRP